MHMTKVEDIEKAIARLSPDEFAHLKDFVDELNEKLFDERIESDVKVGKLDWLASTRSRRLWLQLYPSLSWRPRTASSLHTRSIL